MEIKTRSKSNFIQIKNPILDCPKHKILKNTNFPSPMKLSCKGIKDLKKNKSEILIETDSYYLSCPEKNEHSDEDDLSTKYSNCVKSSLTTIIESQTEEINEGNQENHMENQGNTNESAYNYVKSYINKKKYESNEGYDGYEGLKSEAQIKNFSLDDNEIRISSISKKSEDMVLNKNYGLRAKINLKINQSKANSKMSLCESNKNKVFHSDFKKKMTVDYNKNRFFEEDKENQVESKENKENHAEDERKQKVKQVDFNQDVNLTFSKSMVLKDNDIERKRSGFSSILHKLSLGKYEEDSE